MDDMKPSDNGTKPADLTPEEKLAECQKKCDEYLAGWQRARADFLNYKREEAQRFEDLLKFGTEDMMKDLIGILDSFDLGIAALEKAGPVERGIYMIRSKLEETMKQRGLERIQLKPGEQFNPSVAEAIAEAESDQPVGTVMEEIEPGYRLGGKILRPARVKVSKGKIS
jgi:molecular chaperone GrpE